MPEFNYLNNAIHTFMKKPHKRVTVNSQELERIANQYAEIIEQTKNIDMQIFRECCKNLKFPNLSPLEKDTLNLAMDVKPTRMKIPMTRLSVPRPTSSSKNISR